MAGPFLYITPSNFTSLRADILTPLGSTGHFLSVLDVPGGRYWGDSGVFATEHNPDFVTISNQALSWRFQPAGGVMGGVTEIRSVASMGAAHSNSGAWVGFAMGCNANATYFDDIELTDTGGTYTANLEADSLTPGAHIEYSRNNSSVRDGNLTLAYGQRFWALGHSHDHHKGIYYAGQGRFRIVDRGTNRVSWTGITGFSPDAYASVRITPTHNSYYSFLKYSDELTGAGSSENMYVNVRALVKAKIADHTLKTGQSVVVTGRLRPGNRGTRVTMQRKIGRKWVSQASSRTRAGGAYRIAKKAKSAGSWNVRVVAASTRLNVGNLTKPMHVTVKKRKPPKPSKADKRPGYDYSTPVYDTTPTYAPRPDRGHSSGGHGRVAGGSQGPSAPAFPTLPEALPSTPPVRVD